MDSVNKTVIMLLSHRFAGAEIDREMFDNLSGEQQKKLYRLSVEQNISQIVGDIILNSGLETDEKLKKRYNSCMLNALYNSAKQDRTLTDIGTLLSSGGIPYVPLKGSVLKKYYPESWMRTSSDIDVLVREDDYSRAIELIKEKISYEEITRTSHDITLRSPTGVDLELHHRLFGNSDLCGDYLTNLNAWDYAFRTEEGDEETTRHDFTDEFFYFYAIAHMAKHFLYGGCGIRFFIDLKVMNERLSEGDRYGKLIKESGLESFLKASERLCSVWFDGEEHDELSGRFENRILDGGLFADAEKYSAALYIKEGGHGKAVLSRIWLSRDDLKGRYPQVKDKPYLAPFYQVKRWFNLLDKDKMESSIREAKSNTSVTIDEVEKSKKLFDDLGL